MYLILHYLERYKTYVFFSILAILGFAAAEPGTPTIVPGVIDSGIVLNDHAYIYRMGAAILTVAIAGGIGNVLLTYCSSRASTRITRDIRNDIFRKAQEFSHTEYNKFEISSMVTRTTNDAFILMQFINIILRIALLAPIMIIVSIFMVVRISVTLSMVIEGYVPVICLGVYLVARTSNPTSTRQQKGLNHLSGIARENLTGAHMIRTLYKGEYETERLSDTNENYAKNTKELFKLMSVVQPSFFLLLNLAVSIVFILSSRFIDMGSLQVGNLVASQEYMFHVMFSMMLFSLMFVIYPRTEISARRIKELLDEQSLVQNPKNPVLSGDGSGTLVFDHVPLQYPSGEAPTLRDVTFEARHRDAVAFIGSTGSEENTLINLIPRFYDIGSGSIHVGNVDVRKYDLKVLREKIGFIPQKALLFTGSVTENICYGKHDAVRSEVEHSAKVTQAYDFVTEKPHQFGEMIEEDGSSVPGGQRQRLNIARVMMRKPDIYMFDDSFSALDFKTGANLRRKSKEETEDTITLIVTQRVTSIMGATKVIIFNEGVVVDMGAHRELPKSCSIYREITTSQLSEEELAQ